MYNAPSKIMQIPSAMQHTQHTRQIIDPAFVVKSNASGLMKIEIYISNMHLNLKARIEGSI